MFMRPTTPSSLARALVWRSISWIHILPTVCGGSTQAESPEWMPASSMCSMMPAT